MLQSLHLKDADILLDAGAGRGVFSIPLSRRCRFIVAIDITFRSLQDFKEFVYYTSTSYFIRYENFPEEKICLIQADMCHLPFRKDFRFDKAISAQVVSHIGGAEERKKSIKEVWKYLKPNGIFVLTVGNDSFIRCVARFIKGTPKEAILENGSGFGYYYKFRASEFQVLLEEFFTVQKLSGLLSPALYLAGLSEKVANFLERMINKFSPVSWLLGDILLAECHSKGGRES